MQFNVFILKKKESKYFNLKPIILFKIYLKIDRTRHRTLTQTIVKYKY